MANTVLTSDTTASLDLADLDLDVKLSESPLEGADFGSAGAAATSPNTWGVQSRCWTCCA